MAHENADASSLAPFIGDWTVEADFPEMDTSGMRASTSFGWLFDRRFVVQRSEIDMPEAPDGHMVITPDPRRPGAFRQHYFDSRGVVRLYDMTFDGRIWTLARTEPDFTPLEFHQRFTGTFNDDGDSIDGQWETSPDGSNWELDFGLTYRRQR